jgi:hypothetical protein
MAPLSFHHLALYMMLSLSLIHNNSLPTLHTRRDEHALLAGIVLPATSERLATTLLCVRLDPSLKLGPEVSDQTLDGPGEGLAESANSVTLDLLGELLHHVNLALTGSAHLEAVHDLLGPLGTLATRGALAAGLVVVELAETGDGADDVGGLVHDDDGSRTETGLRVLEGVKVHELVVADVLGEDGGGRATGDDGLEVVPAADDTAAVLVDELAERDGHLLLDGGGVVDVAGDTEELGTSVTLATERVEPASTATDDSRGDSDGLDVGNGGRAAEETNGSREWGLQAGLAGLALEGLDERSLLATDVSAHTTVDVDVKVVARAASVLADQTGLVCFLDGALEHSGLVVELATNVNVRSGALK